MKAFLLIIAFFILTGFANNTMDSLFKCPFKNGIAIKTDINKITELSTADPIRSIQVKGVKSSVFGIAGSLVKKVYKSNNKFVIIVSAKKYVIGYQNLDSVFVKENQIIGENFIIGISKSNFIEVIVNKGLTEVFNPEKLFDCKCQAE